MTPTRPLVLALLSRAQRGVDTALVRACEHWLAGKATPREIRIVAGALIRKHT